MSVPGLVLLLLGLILTVMFTLLLVFGQGKLSGLEQGLYIGGTVVSGLLIIVGIVLLIVGRKRNIVVPATEKRFVYY